LISVTYVRNEGKDPRRGVLEISGENSIMAEEVVESGFKNFKDENVVSKLTK